MTASQRFERDLPDLLADLLAGPAPDYRDTVLLETARVRQRPGWTFPERWLPMGAEGLVQSTVPPLPWRALGVLALLAILVTAFLIGAGRQERRLPPPFGPARNGLVAFTIDGDIAIADLSTAGVRAITHDPADEYGPSFSPDGTRLAWERRRQDGDRTVADIVVAAIDGSGAHGVTDEPLFGPISSIQWSSDSRSILVGYKAQGSVVLYDAAGSSLARTLISNAYAAPGAFRPPDGRQFLARRLARDRYTLLLVGSGGAPVSPLLQIAGDGGPSGGDQFPAAWSPDGARLALSQFVGSNGERHLFVLNADGTGLRDVYGPTGVAVIRPEWSPDGTQILVQQGPAISNGPDVPPLVVLTIADGTVEAVGLGSATRARAATWSPDGHLILVDYGADGAIGRFDLDSGVWTALGFRPDALPTWQRLAP